jgi:inner membrane protein
MTGIALRDPWVQIAAHRGITHSLFFAPIFGVLLGWVFWLWSKRRSSYWWWYLLAFLVLFTHPLLDCCTSYGTQIFTPFSNVRVAWNWVSIVDIFYSLPLFLTLIICALLRKWKPGKNTSWLGVTALLLTTTYLTYGGWNHFIAQKRALADAKDKQITILHVEAYPQLANVWVWRTVVKTPDGYLLGRTNTLVGKTVESTFLSDDVDPSIDKAWSHEKIKIYRWFANDLLRKKLVKSPQGGGVVEFLDMRYGNPVETNSSLWGARVYVNPDGSLGDVERFYNRSFSLGELLNRTFKGIITP